MSKKEKPKLEELKTLQEKGRLVLNKNLIFTQRKKELMNRDPLVKAYLKELSLFDFEKDKDIEGLEKQRKELESKWNVVILNKVFGLPSSPIISFQQKELSRFPPGELVISNRTKGYPISSLPPSYMSSFEWLEDVNDTVNIQVDLRLINFNSAKLVKNLVWEIVKKNLKGRKKEIPREPKELDFLYGIRRQDTFDSYIHWFDMHTKDNLGFRLIAFWNKTSSRGNVKYEEWLEGLRSMRWKVRRPVRGEDQVANGVKLIWKAIYREPYSREKAGPIMEDWNCPQHGRDYHRECRHCRALLQRFNRMKPENKGYVKTMDQDDIDSLYYVGIGRLPRKRNPSKSNDEDENPVRLNRFQFPQYPKLK